MGLTARIINKPELVKKLDELAGKAAEKAMRTTMNEIKKRAPGKVAKAVTKRYNIKQGEVKPDTGGGSAISAGKSSLHFGGTTIADMTLTYVGNLLTPLHFNMSATSGRIQKIKATILKGSRKQIGHHGPPYSEGGAYSRGVDSPYFLTANSSGGNQRTLPFQRKAGESKPSHVFKTVSIPQMVSHESVGPVVLEEIQKLAVDRLAHNMGRALG